LEVLGEAAGRQVATEDRPFEGISADSKDGEATVWIAFTSTPDDVFTHAFMVRQRSACARATVDSGAAVEIEARDGTITLLILSRPKEYARPAADPGENR
jgi:hypothetical protein